MTWILQSCPESAKFRSALGGASSIRRTLIRKIGLMNKNLPTRRREPRLAAKITGRCDPFFQFNHRNYITEAEVVWPSLKSRDLRAQVHNKLRAAKSAARETRTFRDCRRLAVVFVNPRIAKGSLQEFRDLLRPFVEYLTGLQGCAVAWTFPKETRTAFFKKGEGYYPGSAIILRPLRLAG